MICLDDLLAIKAQNNGIIKELEIENRVIDKLIAVEESKELDNEENIEENI